MSYWTISQSICKKTSYIGFSPSHMLQLFMFYTFHLFLYSLASRVHQSAVWLSCGLESQVSLQMLVLEPALVLLVHVDAGRVCSQAYHGPDLKRPQRGSRFKSTTFSVDENRESELTEKTLQSPETHGLLHGKNQFYIHVKHFWAAKFMDGENIRAILWWFSGNRSTPLNPASFISRVM